MYTANNQITSFLFFVLVGIILTIIFDMFRILRKGFKTSNKITYIEDIIYWIIAGIILMYSIFIFHNGETRWYIFLGIALGSVIYLKLFSNIFIKMNVKIILLLKNIAKKVALVTAYPLKLVFQLFKKIFLKPISFQFINIRKSIKNLWKLYKKQKHEKNTNYHKTANIRRIF